MYGAHGFKGAGKSHPRPHLRLHLKIVPDSTDRLFDWQRRGMPAQRHGAHNASKVFLSYSRTDAAFVGRLAAALEGAGYVSVFDKSEKPHHDDPDLVLSAQDEWWLQLKRMIAASDVMIFVVSPDSALSRVCDDEIAHARNLGKRIIAILHRPIDFSVAPERLRALNVEIAFGKDDPESFETALEELRKELDRDIDWYRRGAYFSRLAQAWDEANPPRPNGKLLPHGAIVDADGWIAARPANGEPPGEVLLAFLKASRQRSVQERRRLFMLMAATVMGFIVALVFGVISESRQRQLSVTNQKLIESNRATELQRNKATQAFVQSFPATVNEANNQHDVGRALRLILAGVLLETELNWDTWGLLIERTLGNRGIAINRVNGEARQAEFNDAEDLAVLLLHYPHSAPSVKVIQPTGSSSVGDVNCRQGKPRDIAMEPKGTAIAVLCEDTVLVSTIERSSAGIRIGRTREIAVPGTAIYIAFSANGTMLEVLLRARADHLERIGYDPETGSLKRRERLITPLPGDDGDDPLPRERNQSRRPFATSESYGILTSMDGWVLDLRSGKIVGQFPFRRRVVCGQDVCDIYSSASSTGGQVLATWGFNADRQAYTGALTARAATSQLTPDKAMRLAGVTEMSSIHFAPSARLAAVSSYGGTTFVDISRDPQKSFLIGTTGRQLATASASGTLVALADRQGFVRVLLPGGGLPIFASSLAGGERSAGFSSPVAELEGRAGVAQGISRSGRYYAAITKEEIAILDTNAKSNIRISVSSLLPSAHREIVRIVGNKDIFGVPAKAFADPQGMGIGSGEISDQGICLGFGHKALWSELQAYLHFEFSEVFSGRALQSETLGVAAARGRGELPGLCSDPSGASQITEENEDRNRIRIAGTGQVVALSSSSSKPIYQMDTPVAGGAVVANAVVADRLGNAYVFPTVEAHAESLLKQQCTSWIGPNSRLQDVFQSMPQILAISSPGLQAQVAGGVCEAAIKRIVAGNPRSGATEAE